MTLREPELPYHRLYINGAWCDAADGQTFEVTAPLI
jgi:hypothetical protein